MLSVLCELLSTKALQCFLHDTERRAIVACLGEVAFEHFAFVVDCSPELYHLAIDGHSSACADGLSGLRSDFGHFVDVDTNGKAAVRSDLMKLTAERSDGI